MGPDLHVISKYILLVNIFIRVFMYPMTPEDLTYNLAATAALFEPVLTEVREKFSICHKLGFYNPIS